MPPRDSDDYENSILTQLYSRKATRKAFNMIRADFKKQTGKDLCTLISQAQREVSQDILEIPEGEKGQRLREKAFKLIDYSTWGKYCEVEK